MASCERDSSGGPLADDTVGKGTASRSAMKLAVVQGDLLDQPVDVIVNAWNRNFIPWWLLLPQGVAGAIRKRAGVVPFREVGRAGVLRVGQVVLTTAGRLRHKAIIHVAGINAFWMATERGVRESTRNAIELAARHGFDSIAFPLIGSGTGGFAPSKAKQLMLEEIGRLDFPLNVTLVEYSRN